MRCVGLLLALLTLPSARLANAGDPSSVDPERIVFTTRLGDLVFALHSEAAPRHAAHLKRLTELGAYDGTFFSRLEPGFVLQLSTVETRVEPLSAAQREANTTVPAEFSDVLVHQKGTLSMARWDDPDSATSSFSILLDRAAHLDGRYTIIGYLESGADTVNRILAQPRNAGGVPTPRVVVESARILADVEAYYSTRERTPASLIDGYTQPPVSEEATNGFGIALLVVIIVISLAGFAGFEHLSKKLLLSLLMLQVLVAGFGLLVLASPLGHRFPVVAALLFVATLALFKFMNRFESKS